MRGKASADNAGALSRPMDKVLENFPEGRAIFEQDRIAFAEAMGDPDTFYAFHLNLIKHGREICVARNPRCGDCFLQEECDYYQRIEQEASN